MSDPTDATLHGKALLAFGFDLASLRQGMELPGVRWFLSGFTRAREALGTMVLTASLSMGVQCYGHRGPTLPRNQRSGL